MEHEVERLVLAVLSADGVLDLLEDAGREYDVARLVDAVHVAEGRGDHVAPALAEAELGRGGQTVLRCGEELGVVGGGDAVLLAADHADLELHDDVGSVALVEELLGDVEVLLERHGRAVPHVRLEERKLARGDACQRDVDQRPHVAVELVLGAVVGVQRDLDVVLLRDDVGELRERDRARDHVLHGLAGGELRSTPRELDDAVALGLGEAADRGDDGLGRHAVDRGVGERAGLGAVEHLGVDLRGGDGHKERAPSRRGLTAVGVIACGPAPILPRTT